MNPLGLMNQMWAAPEVSDREALDTALAEIRFADELGFSSIWIGEHHGARPTLPFYGRVPAPELLMAYLAASTRKIVVGSGVRILSEADADRVAEEMSLLDLITHGRVEFGVGLGSNQLHIKGTREEKAARFRATLRAILAVLAGGPMASGAALSPAAPPGLASRIWAAARDAPTLDFLAQHNVNLVVGQAELPQVQARYVAHYRAAGGTGLTRGVRLVFVAPTPAEAEEASEAALRLYAGVMQGGDYHREAVDAGLLASAPESRAEWRRQLNFIVGAPDEVATALREYLAVTGVDRLDLMTQIPGLKTADVRRSLALIQSEVRPHLWPQERASA